MVAVQRRQRRRLADPNEEAQALIYGQVSERQLQERLRLLCLRQQVPYYHTHNSLRSQPGFPDTVIIRPPARFPAPWLILAELKTERGRLSDAQQQWRAALEAVAAVCPGVAYFLWRPSDWPDIIALLGYTT